MEQALPRIALTVGDPAGIGPEIVARALESSRVAAQARVLALGPASARPPGVPLIERSEVPQVREHAWLLTEGAGDWQSGVAQASAGRAALAALRAGHELALAGIVDALVCAPVSKEALHKAGERVEGQTELLGRWCGCPVEMLAIARELRVLLLTRHRPLKEALAAITSRGVQAHLVLLDRGLRQLGFRAPRLALAGLNPHASENGLFGSEERDCLEPALREARAAGLDVTGPLAPDTVFLRAARGEFDGVLALYHDQAFIPLKLYAPYEGITVLLGLPYLRVSPAHGVAFDIAGRGRADPQNLIVALEAAARFSTSYSPLRRSVT